MAKFYGIAGTRRGSVGNETYYISKTQNIVKKKATFVFDPRTEKQITQRIKIKNCLLGLKNVKNALELNTFTNEQVIENHENAFVKNNVRNCCIIDRITSNIPNFPTLSSNVVCSYGTLDSLYVASNDSFLGVVFPGVESDNKTIAQLTNEIITEYEFLRNGDAITFFYYLCTNITSSNDKLFEWDNPEILNNTIDIITGRKTFILNTNDNRNIEQLGFTCIQSDIEDNEIILTVNVKDEGDDLITITNSDYPGYISVFYSRLIDENIYNFCVSASGFNKGYLDMVNFTKKKEYQYFALSSWNTNFKDDNDNDN